MIILDSTLKPQTVRGLTSEQNVRSILTKCRMNPASPLQASSHTPFNVAHGNYLSYLELCWTAHYNAVITPDIIWYTLLCEIAQQVKATPEQFRHLFTASEGTQDIIVPSASDTVLPLDLIIDQLKRLVPGGADKYLPRFTTSTEESNLALYAAFADTVSPYYNYMMYACGIPGIDVRGTQVDWVHLNELSRALPLELWPTLAGSTLIANLVNEATRNDPEFWRGMFNLEYCGSGHQTEVTGWIRKLFFKQPGVAYVENFSSHISRVNYKNLDTNKDYSLLSGLLSSSVVGTTLEPTFGWFVVENQPAPERESFPTMSEIRLMSTPVTAQNKKLDVLWTTEADQQLEQL